METNLIPPVSLFAPQPAPSAPRPHTHQPPPHFPKILRPPFSAPCGARRGQPLLLRPAFPLTQGCSDPASQPGFLSCQVDQCSPRIPLWSEDIIWLAGPNHLNSSTGMRAERSQGKAGPPENQETVRPARVHLKCISVSISMTHPSSFLKWLLESSKLTQITSEDLEPPIC